jgi:hypothetical protein
MTDEEIQCYLEDNGYPSHVVKGGREYLLRRYREFVGEVEGGYEYGIHEYRHDLDLRAAIATIDLNSEVAAEDERFAAMLTSPDTRVWESMAGEPFWDFGYPRNARGRLLRDLRALKLTAEPD